MFDNLRDEAASSPYYEEEEQAKYQPAKGTGSGGSSRKSSSKFLGMTSTQRFVISFLIFMAVCVIGAMFLLITNKIGF